MLIYFGILGKVLVFLYFFRIVGVGKGFGDIGLLVFLGFKLCRMFVVYRLFGFVIWYGGNIVGLSFRFFFVYLGRY